MKRLLPLSTCLLFATSARAEGPCDVPPRSNYDALLQAAQEDATLANGLKAIADFCFDMNDAWTGGANAVPTARGQPRPELAGDCERAVAFCEAAAIEVNKNQPAHGVGSAAVEEMRASFNGKAYRFVEQEALSSPDQAYSCLSRGRAELLRSAANRRAIAQKHLAVLKEYQQHHWVWVHGESMSCANAERARELELARKAAEELKKAEKQAKAKKLAEEERRRREEVAEEARKKKVEAEQRAAALAEKTAQLKEAQARRATELKEREEKASPAIRCGCAADRGPATRGCEHSPVELAPGEGPAVPCVSRGALVPVCLSPG